GTPSSQSRSRGRHPVQCRDGPRSYQPSNRKSSEDSPEYIGNDDEDGSHRQNKPRSLQAQHARNTEGPRDRKGTHRKSRVISSPENGDCIRMIWKRVRGQTGKGAFPPETGGIEPCSTAPK